MMNLPKVKGLIQLMRDKRILVIGDVMLDQFIWGHVRRISPEAPVPVVEVTKERFYPGGAANVARNLSPFTVGAMLMGRVGKDEQAERMRELLKKEGVNSELLLVHDEVATISKMRVVSKHQQIVRVDREELRTMDPKELEQVMSWLREAGSELDAIVIEDYGKGFVTQQLVDQVAVFAKEYGIKVTADPSPRNPLNWCNIDLVKPNRSEAFSAAGVHDQLLNLPPLENPEVLEVGQRLLKLWEVPAVLVTLGEQGMMLFERGGARPYHIPTRAREVFDVSGAGDTAIALLTLALSSGASIIEAADLANHASGIVVGKSGTASIHPEELIACYVNENEVNE
jgi:D-beta-D-heptose 7-phosphate kinase/D-beta-D-heptose 1-phosphate adenosyltransferase